jgi:heme-degrading monooxygenase HmoA
MYAVIFKAEFKHQNEEYFKLAKRMRELARNKYGCVGFLSTCEGENEISISYWESEDQVRRWKQDEEHIKAQEKGKTLWYKSYSVEVCEVIRSYKQENEVRVNSL